MHAQSQTNVEVTKEEDWNTLLRMEEEYIENICAQIVAFHPDIVITEKGVSDLAQHYLMKADITVSGVFGRGTCTRWGLGEKRLRAVEQSAVCAKLAPSGAEVLFHGLDVYYVLSDFPFDAFVLSASVYVWLPT